MSWLDIFLAFWRDAFFGEDEEGSCHRRTNFRCLVCGHNMSETVDTTCPSCGDEFALDPDRHQQSPYKDISGLEVRGEIQRRVCLQREAELGALVGRTGTAQSPLRPAGEIEIDGKQYPVTAETAFLPPQTQVLVVGIKGASLIVRQKS